MSDFEQKLNGILSNPQEMDKIMAIARQLMGGTQAQAAPPAAAQPSPLQWGPPPGYQPPAQGAYPPPQMGPSPAWQPPPPAPPPPAGGLGLDGLLGGLDPKMIGKLAKGFSGGSAGSATLLQSITPHLGDTRQGQLKRALMIAQMVRVAKGYLTE